MLKLDKYDMVLRVDWIWNYSPILFYLIKIKLSFKKERRIIKLKGINKVIDLQMIIVVKIHKSLIETIFGFIRQFY
jgi:hypothetical protein